MRFLSTALTLLLVGTALYGQTPGTPQPLYFGITIRPVVVAGEGAIRVVKHPVTNTLYILYGNGDIYTIEPPFTSGTKTLLFTTSDHGVASPTGITVGMDGSFYLVGNLRQDDNNIAMVKRGTLLSGVPGSVWEFVAQTEAYPRSNTNYDHTFNGIAISPDGKWLYLNSGSRTDHGELQETGGKFPGLREVPLTSAIFRVPADTEGVVLRNDEEYLRTNGYLYADGTRNSFDLAFAPGGNLFATENSGDRDDNEELNWIRQGRHYGFPWRMGTNNTPQQYATYDPAEDKLINPESYGSKGGFYYNDPSYPPRPDGVDFTDPIQNLGADAVKYRDSASGEIRSGTARAPVGTFTPHRSPLGLVFDSPGAMPDPFRWGGFVLSWTQGTQAANDLLTPFDDPGEDLIHLELAGYPDRYEIRSRQIAKGFGQPIDAEIIGARIYVLDYGGSHTLWEVDISGMGSVDKEGTSGSLLSAAAPNPFARDTRITIVPPATGHVRIDAFDILGRRVAALYDGTLAAGVPHNCIFSGEGLPDGVYVIAAQGETFRATTPATLAR